MRTGQEPDGLCEGSGLAWLQHEGRVLTGKRMFNPLITGYPCWLRGNTKRFLFPAGDGQLYVQSLDTEDSSEGESLSRVEGWGSGLDGSERAIIADVVRPIVPRLGGRLLVAVNPPVKGRGQHRYGRSEIWWLALDAGATRIEACGPLIQDDEASRGDRRGDERMPNAVCTPDGRVALAYLRRHPETNEWSLQLAPLEIDPTSRIPFVSPSESREVAKDSAVTMPAFTPDGRSLFYIPRTMRKDESPTKISVLEVLGPIRGSCRPVSRPKR